jgi:hypothetical protein
VAANSAMGIELVGSLPGRADSQMMTSLSRLLRDVLWCSASTNSKNAFEIAGGTVLQD